MNIYKTPKGTLFRLFDQTLITTSEHYYCPHHKITMVKAHNITLGHRQGNRRDRNARSIPNETGDKMNQEEIIQDAFDQLLHEQRVSNKGSIETTKHRDNSVECNLSNGWMVERITFTSYSTGLPIVASTSVCLYDNKGELVRETVFTHENKDTPCKHSH
jgi:hypothetical protein